MSKPTRFPDWALDNVTEVRSGKSLPNKINVPDSFRNSGTLDGLIPLQFVNDQFNLLGEWVRFFEQSGQSAPPNQVIVASLADLPTPVGGEIILENDTKYLFVAVVISPYTLVVPAGATVTISSINLSNPFVYVGGGKAIKNADGGTLVMDFFSIQAAVGGYFDFDNAGTVFAISLVCLGQTADSKHNCNVCVFFFCDFQTGAGSITFGDRTDGLERSRSSLSHCSSTGSGAGVPIAHIKGTKLRNFAIQESGFTTGGVGDSCVLLDKELKEGGITTFAFFGGFLNNDAGGNKLHPDSLNQTFPKGKITAVDGLPDSTTKSKIRFIGNSLPTTISVLDQPFPIQTNAPAEITIFERILLQDTVTFNEVNDTLTTTFNHNLALNDVVRLHAYVGATLPAELEADVEYYVINPTATTFQLSLTPSGAAIDFTDNGTGTLYYRHGLGSHSVLMHMIYIGEEPITIAPSGWNSIINTINSNDDVRGIVMKINLDGSIVEDQIASKININNTRPQSSQTDDIIDLEKGEGVVVYVKNSSGTANLIVEDALTNIKKV
jgi:hypothetical protein